MYSTISSVKRIHPDQLHIAIDGTHGRVHATEVHDELTDVGGNISTCTSVVKISTSPIARH